jgi:2-polyprenyl-3-methyl-5-hydroxy-6-metoxy-1,4-benzoquinol methylase
MNVNFHESGVKTHNINVSEIVSDRFDYLAKIVKGKRVVHIGCTDYPFTIEKYEANALLHQEIMENASDVLGVDLDEDGINFLKRNNPDWKLISLDLTQKNNCELFKGYDLVLFPEVIEHLSNPGGILDSIVSNMDSGSELVITTPNAFSWRAFLRALFGKETLHKDHLAIYSFSTIRQLLGFHGLEVVDVVGYGKGLSNNPVKKLMTFFIWLWHKYSSATIDGLIVKAKKLS